MIELNFFNFHACTFWNNNFYLLQEWHIPPDELCFPATTSYTPGSFNVPGTNGDSEDAIPRAARNWNQEGKKQEWFWLRNTPWLLHRSPLVNRKWEHIITMNKGHLKKCWHLFKHFSEINACCPCTSKI